ncbi:hypothetical protein KY284_036523 [Solanum tuberosum]|nr:hypothetical protein KY284_036523 [Solanum tuberosum]
MMRKMQRIWRKLKKGKTKWGKPMYFRNKGENMGIERGAITYVVKEKEEKNGEDKINEDGFFETAKENHKGILDEKNEDPKTPIDFKAEENQPDAHSVVGELTKRSNMDHNYSLSSIQLTTTKRERKQTIEKKRKEAEEGQHEAQKEGQSQTGGFDMQNQVNINETTKAPEIDKMTNQEKSGEHAETLVGRRRFQHYNE